MTDSNTAISAAIGELVVAFNTLESWGHLLAWVMIDSRERSEGSGPGVTERLPVSQLMDMVVRLNDIADLDDDARHGVVEAVHAIRHANELRNGIVHRRFVYSSEREPQAVPLRGWIRSAGRPELTPIAATEIENATKEIVSANLLIARAIGLVTGAQDEAGIGPHGSGPRGGAG